MGIYGALSTAVTGLSAQSFALDNISGNIANSQTIGFKRVDTSFLDLIPDQPSKIQTSGSVLAQSQSTATEAGDVKSVTNATYMAVNGSGFFVVQPALGESDGTPVFGGTSYYTRRGDFDVNKDGYLVNGSGYYLQGLPIDTKTGNISSSLPQVIRVSNSFLPAQPTSTINYQLNLPQLPKDGTYQTSQTSGSELMQASDFETIPTDTAAATTGSATMASFTGKTTAFADGAAATGSAAASTIATNGDTLTVTIGSTAHTYHFTNSGGTDMTTGTIDITDNVAGTDTVQGVLSAINTDLQTSDPTASASLVNGKIRIATGDTTDSLTVANGTTGFGLASATTAPTLSSSDAASRLASSGNTLTVTIGSVTRNYTFTNSGGTSGTTIDTTDASTSNVGQVLAYIQSDLATAGATNAQVGLQSGQVHIASGNTTDTVTVADSTVGFGVGNVSATAGMAGTDPASRLAVAGNTLEIKVGSADRTYTFTTSGASSGTTININDPSTNTVAGVLAAIQSDLQGNGAAGATVGLSSGKIAIGAGNLTDSITTADNTSGMGIGNVTKAPSVSTAAEQAARVATITADDADTFDNQSISGGAITVYASNGAPANVQLRWAKIASSEVGGADRWQLFYQSNSTATGSQPMWTNVGTDYTFGSDGALNPPISETDLSGVSVDGVSLGNIKLNFGTGGITQFADPNGTAGVTALTQNGYSAGQYQSVAIDDSGRVVVSYDNGQTVQTAQVVTANFNAADSLKRMDGGIFAATADSGQPILNTSGGVIGSSLESSNTDISTEFTKLIVTQQAYAAGTKIVSTADDMLQQALNMIR